jgi:unsaturated rhamnogalacturonyl hydrolase
MGRPVIMLNVTGQSWWVNPYLLLSQRTCAIIILILFARTQMLAQQTSGVPTSKLPLPYVGDAPIEPAIEAGGLSPTLRSNAVREAILKVGDWQLRRAAGRFSNSWEFGALYDGYVAAGEALREPRYLTAMTQVAQSLDWKLRSPDTNPDNEAAAQMYLDLAVLQHRQDVLNSIQSEFNGLLLSQHDTHPWSWCDTLFMAPPVWAHLYAITGEKQYLDYLDREWWNTSAALYVPDVHLYMRDKSFRQAGEQREEDLLGPRQRLGLRRSRSGAAKGAFERSIPRTIRQTVSRHGLKHREITAGGWIMACQSS